MVFDSLGIYDVFYYGRFVAEFLGAGGFYFIYYFLGYAAFGFEGFQCSAVKNGLGSTR